MSRVKVLSTMAQIIQHDELLSTLTCLEPAVGSHPIFYQARTYISRRSFAPIYRILLVAGEIEKTAMLCCSV